MSPKEVKFALCHNECSTRRGILVKYIKGLEQMLAENATTIYQLEELLYLQDTEIEGLRNEVEALEYSLSNERCL